MSIRPARPEDAAAIVRLVNTAYEVERSFVAGDRTNPEEIRAAIGSGTVLVGVDEAGRIVATVHVEISSQTASFGLLAVDPAAQRQGWGRRLIAMAEERARAAGIPIMTIRVVSARKELVARYARLGYTAVATEPYTHRPVSRPVHFVVMEKSL